ncbi:MAG: hypothetical protein KJ587_10060 [Alphaproteobacteria bacterium]|nr:hypothetical protein [Alphaproteobacteria bacterium]
MCGNFVRPLEDSHSFWLSQDYRKEYESSQALLDYTNANIPKRRLAFDGPVAKMAHAVNQGVEQASEPEEARPADNRFDEILARACLNWPSWSRK